MSNTAKQSESPIEEQYLFGVLYDPEHIRERFLAEDYLSVSEELYRILVALTTVEVNGLSPEEQTKLDLFVNIILSIFTKEAFAIPEPFKERFITLNNIISNLVAMSSYGSTDKAIQVINSQPYSYSKILVLYSHRNRIHVPLDMLFKTNPHLASHWWASVIINKFCCVTKEEHEKLLSFFDTDVLEEYFELPLNMNGQFVHHKIYALSAYIVPDKHRKIKEIISAKLQEHPFYSKQDFTADKPNFSKIAVISQTFYRRHASYKCLAPLLYTLKKDYQLILVNLKKDDKTVEDVDKELFDEVIYLSESPVPLLPTEEMVESLRAHDFGIVFYPEVGQDMVSTLLAHYRIAPIQMAAYGNPMTSASPEIDYMIGSRYTEPEGKAEEHYSERLVLLPRLCQQPIIPEYQCTNPLHDTNKVVIGCAWSNIKYFYPHLMTLRRILERSSKPIELLFIGLENQFFMLPPMMKELKETLPADQVQIHARADYEGYMSLIEQTDFTVDSYPYGSYNCVIDSLICHRPMVVLEADYAAGRLGAALLRKLGLEELVAVDEEAFVEKTLRLIEDDDYRRDLTARIAALDLEGLLHDDIEAQAFKKGIDYLVEHHEELKNDKSNAPIIIEA